MSVKIILKAHGMNILKINKINMKIKSINKSGLDDKTKEILSKECYFIKEYIENKTLFYEIKNIDGDIVRIFQDRIIKR